MPIDVKINGCLIPFWRFLVFVRFLNLAPSSEPKGCLIGDDIDARAAITVILVLKFKCCKSMQIAAK